MAENTFYKKEVTAEEAEACFTWFEQHMDELPATFNLGKGMYIPDVKAMVTKNVHKLRLQMNENPTYSGQFSILVMLKERLQKVLNGNGN